MQKIFLSQKNDNYSAKVLLDLFGNLNKLPQTALKHRGLRQQKGSFRTALLNKCQKKICFTKARFRKAKITDVSKIRRCG